jgi:predicted ATPase/class 3 adenylate cyclase
MSLILDAVAAPSWLERFARASSSRRPQATRRRSPLCFPPGLQTADWQRALSQRGALGFQPRPRDTLAVDRSDLPTGTVTLLFTDIEGSTKLLHELGECYGDALAEHRRVMRQAFARHGGIEVDTQGDAFFVAFPAAADAVLAAEEAQRDLCAGPIRVRMGLHTGEPRVTQEGYVGLDVHRAARIAGAAHGGQIVMSKTTRDLVDGDARLHDLGEHRLKDLLDPEWLFQLGSDKFPPLKSVSATNLPLPTNRLIGRDSDRARLRELLLDNDARLVTVTGSGGTGKSRLAVQVGLDLLEEFPNGLFFVELAPFADPQFVVPELARILGVRESTREPLLETIAQSLRDKRLLLVIDNFEHLLEAAPALTTLLRSAAELFVLATSRERLALSGEHEYPLLPLAEASAVSLFVERAQAAGVDVAPNEPVGEICRRLDGLPLALELAAARVKLLSTEQLLRRLERRLPLLTGGPRDAPARQRALEATIQWSYDLLDEREQRNFASLAVFASEFELEAAEEVCGLEVDELASLLDKSLLRRTEAGRVFMLQTIREFALARLADSRDEAELRRRHGAYHVEWLRSSGLSWWEGGSTDWRFAAREKSADLRAALSWALESQPELGVELASSLQGFWFVDGSWSEGAGWFKKALAHSEELAPAVRAKALGGASEFARFRHEHERALALKREAVDLYRTLDDPATLAALLKDLGETAMMLGDHSAAEKYVREALSIREELGDAGGLGHALAGCGEVAMAQSRFDEAAACFERAIACSQETGAQWDAAAAMHSLGEVARRCGDAERAAALFARALEVGLGLDAPPLIGECIEGLAGVQWLRGDARSATRLSAAVDAYLARSGCVLNYTAEHDALIASLRTDLGGDLFAAIWAEGRAARIEEAVGLAQATTAAPA